MSWTNPLPLTVVLVMTGVEHLLRDVKDTTISTLATEVSLIFFPPIFLLMILVPSDSYTPL